MDSAVELAGITVWFKSDVLEDEQRWCPQEGAKYITLRRNTFGFSVFICCSCMKRSKANGILST